MAMGGAVAPLLALGPVAMVLGLGVFGVGCKEEKTPPHDDCWRLAKVALKCIPKAKGGDRPTMARQCRLSKKKKMRWVTLYLRCMEKSGDECAAFKACVFSNMSKPAKKKREDKLPRQEPRDLKQQKNTENANDVPSNPMGP